MGYSMFGPPGYGYGGRGLANYPGMGGSGLGNYPLDGSFQTPGYAPLPQMHYDALAPQLAQQQALQASQPNSMAGIGGIGTAPSGGGADALDSLIGVKQNNGWATVGGDAAKGASIGTMILPGWGTAIGAGAGAIFGGLSDIFGF